MRSDGFSMILSGELEVIAAVSGEADEDGYDEEGGNDGGHTWMILRKRGVLDWPDSAPEHADASGDR